MKFRILHENKGVMRVHFSQSRMSYEQADILLYYLHSNKLVTFAKVYERTADTTVKYVGNRADIIRMLQTFHYEDVDVPDDVIENSGREQNAEYQEKLVNKVVLRFASKMFIPYPLRACITTVKSVKYIYKGLETLLKGKIEVPVLDATAIGVSVIRGDYDTAGSVMFLLGIGELLEEWTHKRSVDDLARTMSLNVGKVWLKTGDKQVQVSTSEIKKGDEVIVHMGNIIPFDGVVTDGEAMVNQASLTGESEPVRRTNGNSVYAGTVIEEGEITLLVKETGGKTKFEKIVTMIEETEKLKSQMERDRKSVV